MERHELLLAGFAAGGENATFTPVQVQKLFFLIDREAASLMIAPISISSHMTMGHSTVLYMQGLMLLQLSILLRSTALADIGATP